MFVVVVVGGRDIVGAVVLALVVVVVVGGEAVPHPASKGMATKRATPVRCSKPNLLCDMVTSYFMVLSLSWIFCLTLSVAPQVALWLLICCCLQSR